MDANDNDHQLLSDSFDLPHFPTGWTKPNLHAAAAAFLAEYETYQKDPNSVIFNPTPAVLEALRKSLGAQS